MTIPEDAELKQLAVTQEPAGWFVSIQFNAPAKEYPSPSLPTIGIDHGLSSLAAWSDGQKIAPPKFERREPFQKAALDAPRRQTARNLVESSLKSRSYGAQAARSGPEKSLREEDQLEAAALIRKPVNGFTQLRQKGEGDRVLNRLPICVRLVCQ